MIDISILTKNDIRFAHRLTEREGWMHLESDLSRLSSFNQDGCLVANYNGNRAGILFSTTCNHYAFLSCLIVDREYRNKGIGEALMAHAIEKLQSAGVITIELDGVFPALPLYRRLGFRDKYLSLRMTRPPHQAQLRKPFEVSFNPDEIICYDTDKTGLDRREILIRFLSEFKDQVYTSGKSKINGYAVVRPRTGDYVTIGPLVADSLSIAEKLILKIIADYGSRHITIGLPETNQAAVEIIKRNRFVYTEPSVRTYLGQFIEYESYVFAIISAEKG